MIFRHHESRLKRLSAFALVLGLAACGNSVDSDRSKEAFKEIAGQAKSVFSRGKKGAPAAVPPDPNAVIAATLEKLPDVPLLFTLRENSGQYDVASIYAQNSETVTWVTAKRDTFSLDRGNLVATRGLGNDLMSVEDGGAARLIAARQSGTVRRTYRFLNGLDQTVRFRADCQISIGDRQTVSAGEITASTTVMREACAAGDYRFTNVYWVDDTGRSVQSLQWAGHANGNIVFRRIR